MMSLTAPTATGGGGGTGRAQQFKPCMTMEDGRRSRDETTVQLRKARKDERMQKRRRDVAVLVGGAGGSSNVSGAGISPTSDSSVIQQQSTKPFELVITYIQWEADPSSVSLDELVETTKGFRRLLTKKNPPVAEVVECGAVPHIAKLLNVEDRGDLVFEAAWALTNIATTKYSLVVAEIGAVPSLTALLVDDVPMVREQSAWCLGNLTSGSTALRDQLLQAPGVIHGLVENLYNPANESLLTNFAWTVSNLCNGKPKPPQEAVRPFLDPLVAVLENCEQLKLGPHVFVDAVWALAYITNGRTNDNTEILVKRGAVPILVRFIENYPGDRKLLIPALRALGNFAAGTNEQTDAVLAAGFLKHAVMLLEHSSKQLKTDCCWLLSNVAACTSNQVDQLFDAVGEYGLKKLIYIAEHNSGVLRRQAIYAITNIIMIREDYARVFVGMDIFGAFSRLMAEPDVRVLLAILEAVDKLMYIGQRHDLGYDLKMEDAGALDMLDSLQYHPNNNVYKSVVAIIDAYFRDDEDEVETENVAPETSGESFAFGLTTKNHDTPAQPLQFHFGGSSTNNVE